MTDESEEIFRRAAENYPLKTDDADWEAVLKKMENSDDDSAAGILTGATKKRNYKSFLLLLLLLITFAVIEYKYASFSNWFGKKKEQQASTESTVARTKHEKQTTERKINNNIAVPETGVNTSVSTDINDVTKSSASTQSNFNQTSVNTDPQAVANQKTNTPSTTFNSATQVHTLENVKGEFNSSLKKHTVGEKAKMKINIANSDAEKKLNKHRPKISYASKQKSKVSIKSVAPTDEGTENEITSIEKELPPVAETTATNITAEHGDAIAKQETAIEKKLNPDTTKPAEKEIAKDTPVTKEKEEKKKKLNEKHFYAALMIGPDFSTVKLQSVKRTGLSYGLIVGYKINKKLSIETGFQYDKKLYSSDGKYFSTKNITALYPNATIEYVSGQCKMYEIPVNVTYRFSQKKNFTWFAAAGISSYLMNKEKYDYDVLYYGNRYPYSKDYKSHDNRFAAVINLSIGYTHTLGKIGDLRIEPYLKLPVHKVGTGELPIQSGGIMIGFTRNLF